MIRHNTKLYRLLRFARNDGWGVSPPRQGSALIYVTVAGIVIAIVLALVISVFTYNHNRTINQKTHTQAYYTAQTLNERIATWIGGVPDVGEDGLGTLPAVDNSIWIEKKDPQKFLENLRLDADFKIEQDIPKSELGDGKLGSAKVTIQYRDPDPSNLASHEKFRNIRITTTATMAGQTETLSLDMSLQVAQTYSVANTDFNYGTEAISKILDEIPLLDNWRAGSVYAARSPSGADTSQWNYFDAAGVNTVVNSTTIGGITAKFTKMNPLFYAEGAKNNRDYNMTYINVIPPTGIGGPVDADLKVCFDYTQGPMSSTGIAPDTFPPGTRLSMGELIMFSYGGGKTFPPDLSNTKTLTYYTTPVSLGEPGMLYPYSIIIAPYLNGGATAETQYFNNFFFYATDLSSADVRIINGVTIQNGGIYTKRSAKIGGLEDVNGTNMLTWNQTHPMIFNNSQMIFADPGEGETQRSSIIQGYNSGSAYVSMNNGNVLVQNRHKLTIGNYVTFACGTQRGITVETGGELVINSGANITSNIYVQNGATLTINGGSITGNIYCSGTLNINGSFIQNPLNSNPDNIELGYVSTAVLNEVPVNLSGTYVFTGTTTSGTLNIATTATTAPEISGTGGKIHTFVTPNFSTPITLSDLQSSGLFAAGSDTNSHVSKEFETGYYAWAVVPGSNKAG